MARHLTTLSAEEVIALCEQGVYESWQGSEPVDLLARGMVESATGDPEKAKDLLSRAYWSLDGEWKDRAGVQLSIAYWRGGESAEAWALLDTLPVSFDVLLTQAIIETDSDPAKALELLSRAQGYEASSHKRGRLHNQRGICFSLLGEPQKAKEEYDAALYFFGDCPLRTLVEANIAEDLKGAESHAVVDRAIADLSGPHLGQAYEGKAQTLFREGEYERAEKYATWAVDLLNAANRRIWLISALITRANIRAAQERPGQALTDLCEAYNIAEYLADADLKLRAAKEIDSLGRSTSKIYHVRSVQIALESSTSFNSAAGKLGISRQGLREFIRTNKLQYQPRRRKTVITKS